MGTGQLILVLFAVILFSTFILTTNTNLFTLVFYAYDTMLSTQGYRIADAIHQEIDAMNVSSLMSFQEIYNTYTFTDSVTTINDVDYYVSSSTNWCTQYGVDDLSGSNSYQRVDLRIYCLYGSDTIRVGTSAHPISNIYASLD